MKEITEQFQWWKTLENNWKKQLIHNVEGLRFKFSENDLENHLNEILRLKSVTLTGEYPVQSFQPLTKLPLLEELEIEDAEDIPDPDQLVNALSALKELKKLKLSDCHLKDISFLKTLGKLEVLRIDPGFSGEGGLEDISALRQLTSLVNLNISGPDPDKKALLNDLSPLENLTNLERLTIDNAQVKDLQSLRKLTSLEYLELRNFSAVSLNGIENLDKLAELSISDFKALEDIDAIGELHTLEALELSECPKIKNVEAVRKLSALKKFKINGSLPIKDLSFLSILKNITAITVTYGELTDISAIRHLDKLEFLMITQYNRKYQGIEVLPELPNLKKVYLNERSLNNATEVLKKLRNDRPGLKLTVAR